MHLTHTPMAPMPKLPLSVLLPTCNNSATIRRTLESICWADEILVVDSFSTDGTLDICREYGARLLQHEYINSARQKNWAIPQCTYTWVLQIDSDEVLEPGLPGEIEAAITRASANVHAFRLPRKNHVLGRWMRFAGIYPDYQTRLLRREVGRWIEREVHAHVTVPGAMGTLRGHILHDGMPHISKQLRNLDRYTRYEADELRKQGRRFRLHQLLLQPGLVFLKRYLWQQGFRDGYRGFIYCTYLATYQFMTLAKLWELEELGLAHSPK